jgi:hypothetical protein
LDFSDYIAHLDGYTVIPGGFLNHHYIQLGYQLADSFSGGLYSFIGTCMILGALDFIGRYVPSLRLRASPEEEILGIDDVEIGEFAVRLSFKTSQSITNGINSTTTLSSAATSSPSMTLTARRKIQVRHSSCLTRHTYPKSIPRRATTLHGLFDLWIDA